jgi:transposase
MIPLEKIFGLGSYKIKEIKGPRGNIFVVESEEEVRCPDCQSSSLRTKGRFRRLVRHVNVGECPSYLELEGRKYRCRDCNRYFNQRFAGILPYRRYSEAYRKEICHWHREGVSQSSLAQDQELGSATVERWYHRALELKMAERRSEECPRILGIDEHFFSRKDGYATTFCNLQKRKVFDVVLGRSEKALESYFQQLKGKEHVQVVCMDLSSTYRAIIRKHMPQARIVADRFHVIRMVNHHFLAVWKQMDPIGSRHRGLLSLMRRHAENMDDDQKLRLQSYLKSHPILHEIYEFKQKLCRLLLMKHCTARQCRRLIPLLLKTIRQLKETGLQPLQSLAATLASWQEEIACMWRFTKNNAITEGFHTKMEMISRRAFGFRNFQNYRLRVTALCA